MAKVDPEPIEQNDIEEYLANESDFAFELHVLQRLTKLGCECQHSGVYDDPVTNTPREFDIRALLHNEYRTVRLAVECKNLRPNYPLLVHCVPRSKREQTHNVLVNLMSRSYQTAPSQSRWIPGHSDTSFVHPHANGLYSELQMLAKSYEQVGKRRGSFFHNDSKFFSKFNQAVNSCYDLITAAHETPKNTTHHGLQLIIPVVVVPDNRIWQVDYSYDGEQVAAPRTVERVTVFIDKTWQIGHVDPQGRPSWSNYIQYSISHLEIISFGALEAYINQVLDKANGLRKPFPAESREALLRAIFPPE